jgi:hypothetical protein
MKKAIAFVFLAAAAAVFVFADGNQIITVSVERIPTTIEDFVELRDELAQTPEGGAAVFVAAMNMYVNDPELGIQAFTIALDRSQLQEASDGYKGFRPGFRYMNLIRSELKQKPYIAPSYFAGTDPGSAYRLPPPPYMIEVHTNPHSDIGPDEKKYFIRSTGADSPRPIYLKKNNREIWKVTNESLILGVRPPEQVIDDDL